MSNAREEGINRLNKRKLTYVNAAVGKLENIQNTSVLPCIIFFFIIIL